MTSVFIPLSVWYHMDAGVSIDASNVHMLSDSIELTDEKIDELVDAFMNAIPPLLKSKLQAA